MAERKGNFTIKLTNKPSIYGSGSVAGKTEGEGPLKDYFDMAFNDDSMGEDSFEKAESLLSKKAIEYAISKAGLTKKDINLILAGDLLNQCIGTTFGIRDFEIPFIGLYGACSTMALSMALASLLVDAKTAKYAVCATSSHFASAERQFRLPLEYGGQVPPSAQRTVTGAGASVIGYNKKDLPYIDSVIFGRIVDLGIKDANNMGAGMAPAAADTIFRFLIDNKTVPDDYDIILTGDLGDVGSKLLIDLMKKDYNIDISNVHKDCGTMIFDLQNQDVHSGGSGCGCSGAVVNSYIMDKIIKKELHKVLFIGTGALLSPTSTLQGESIPSIAHGVLLTSGDA